MHTDFPPELIPLTGNATDTPVLLLDTRCSYIDLQECADMRLNAVRGLLRSLSTMEPGYADHRDLVNVTQAAEILLTDAYDLLAAARQAVHRQRLG